MNPACPHRKDLTSWIVVFVWLTSIGFLTGSIQIVQGEVGRRSRRYHHGRRLRPILLLGRKHHYPNVILPKPTTTISVKTTTTTATTDDATSVSTYLLRTIIDLRGGGSSSTDETTEDGTGDEEDDSDDETDDDEEAETKEEDKLALVMETAWTISQQAGVRVMELSQIAWMYVVKWCILLYNAWKRALLAGIEEYKRLQITSHSTTSTGKSKVENDDDDEEEEEPKELMAKILDVSKTVSIQTYQILHRMTIAFWDFPVEDINEQEEDKDGRTTATTNVPILPSVMSRFNTFFKKRDDEEEVVDDNDDEEVTDDDDDDSEMAVPEVIEIMESTSTSSKDEIPPPIAKVDKEEASVPMAQPKSKANKSTETEASKIPTSVDTPTKVQQDTSKKTTKVKDTTTKPTTTSATKKTKRWVPSPIAAAKNVFRNKNKKKAAPTSKDGLLQRRIKTVTSQLAIAILSIVAWEQTRDQILPMLPSGGNTSKRKSRNTLFPPMADD